MRPRSLRAAIAAALFAPALVAHGKSSDAPLQVADLLKMTSVPSDVAPVISPDGMQVVYGTEVDSSHPGYVQLWVQSTQGGPPRRIGDATKRIWDFSWSPDGKRLAFYSSIGGVERRDVNVWDIGIWEKDADTVHFLDIPAALTGFYTTLQWNPQGSGILVERFIDGRMPNSTISATAARPAPSSSPMVIEFSSVANANTPANAPAEPGDNLVRRGIGSFGPGMEVEVDLILADVRTGAITPIVEKIPIPAFVQLSPDGRQVLYGILTGFNRADRGNVYDLHMGQLGGGSTLLVRDALVKNGCHLIDPEDPAVLHQLPAMLSECFLTPHSPSFVPLAWPDFAHRKTFMDAAASIEALSSPAYSFRLIGPHLSAVTMSPEGEIQLFRLDAASNTLRSIYRGFTEISKISASHDGSRIAYLRGDIAHPSDIWVANSDFSHARQLSHLNPHIPEGSMSASQMTVTWRSPNGVQSAGVVLLPTSYQRGKRYPTIVSQYPGGRGTFDRNTFGMHNGTEVSAGAYFNLQLFATRGYAVFVPDSVVRPGHVLNDIADVALSGVDRVVEMGIADPDRLGVIGQSFGGYGVLALIVQTKRFKAAVCEAGISNLFAVYGELDEQGNDMSDYFETGQGSMGVTPWQDRNRYIENSPFFFLDRVETPVLLQYGGRDLLYPPSQSRNTFAALRRLGKTATLVGYPTDNHVLSDPANQVDFFNRVSDWFAKYLQL